MKAKDPRVVMLTVAEVEDMIASICGAKTARNLSRRQRQQIQDVHDDLVHARDHADDGAIPLPVPLILRALGCATMTQTWLSEMLNGLSVGNTDE